MHWEGGRLQSDGREIPLNTPICIRTSHFESKVDKLEGSEVRCDAMVKRRISGHHGSFRQTDANGML